MKNQWTSLLFGMVKVKIEGRGTERFLNDCIRGDIIVWNVKRGKSGGISFYIRLKDVHALRKVVRKNECKCRFEKRLGFPFLLRKSWRNSGFIIGLLAFLVVIFALSNMIWGIDVEGASPETEHLIKKELSQIGVKKGKFQFFVEDPDEIQKSLTDNIQQITWVGVELTGTTYHLKVVEKNQPEEDELVSPRHIVAEKEAVISKMFVEQGQPLTTLHEHVKKGQILVSGLIGKEDEQKKVAAKAEIFGETWYKSTISIPLKTTFHVFTGEATVKHYLQFGSFKLPIWGFKDPTFTSFEVEDDVRYVNFLNFTMPIAYVNETFRERQEVSRDYTEKQAKEAALDRGRKDIENKLDKDEKVIGEKVLHETNENGKVKLTVLYQVLENIVKTTPIVQGD
ncbi:sporulation protein YqfD [Metabacillus litoralis]|jgi:similar to stage IV sporulation protein|uniref:sporulation protein YqfD n=1 Tax=Metabacillus litoralis TaxID=152268 RepID=UPI00203A631D|nr:sporulation protein YqfD [Metabacillus litoralis]MCM3650515.1 sporulation protein YqfD [Metabacillus litoralis]